MILTVDPLIAGYDVQTINVFSCSSLKYRMQFIGAGPPLVDLLHFGIGCFIPKGDFRGIQKFYQMKKETPANINKIRFILKKFLL